MSSEGAGYPSELTQSDLSGKKLINSVAKFTGSASLTIRSFETGEQQRQLSLNDNSCKLLSQWFFDTARRVTRVVTTKGRKQHIVRRGQTFCQSEISLSADVPTVGLKKPNDEEIYRWAVPLAELREPISPVLMCNSCIQRAQQAGLIRSVDSKREESINCPECGNVADALTEGGETAGSIIHFNETGPKACKLSAEQYIGYYRELFGLEEDQTSYDAAPQSYLPDFPETVTEQTGGLNAEYAQLSCEDRKPADRVSKATGFALTHPDWETSHLLLSGTWGPLYQYAEFQN